MRKAGPTWLQRHILKRLWASWGSADFNFQLGFVAEAAPDQVLVGDLDSDEPAMVKAARLAGKNGMGRPGPDAVRRKLVAAKAAS